MNFHSTHFYICDLMQFQFKKYIYQEMMGQTLCKIAKTMSLILYNSLCSQSHVSGNVDYNILVKD